MHWFIAQQSANKIIPKPPKLPVANVVTEKLSITKASVANPVVEKSNCKPADLPKSVKPTPVNATKGDGSVANPKSASKSAVIKSSDVILDVAKTSIIPSGVTSSSEMSLVAQGNAYDSSITPQQLHSKVKLPNELWHGVPVQVFNIQQLYQRCITIFIMHVTQRIALPELIAALNNVAAFGRSALILDPSKITDTFFSYQTCRIIEVLYFL